MAVGVIAAVIIYRLLTSGGSSGQQPQQEAEEGNGNPERQPAGGPNRDEMTTLEEDAYDMEQMGIGSESAR